MAIGGGNTDGWQLVLDRLSDGLCIRMHREKAFGDDRAGRGPAPYWGPRPGAIPLLLVYRIPLSIISRIAGAKGFTHYREGLRRRTRCENKDIITTQRKI